MNDIGINIHAGCKVGLGRTLLSLEARTNCMSHKMWQLMTQDFAETIFTTDSITIQQQIAQ